MTGVYDGSVIVFGTMHGKQYQVAPAFAETLGASVVAASGIDTDVFGTFSGETARTMPPLETARAKARLAMSASRLYGLASEASYGPLPGVGLTGHEEILLFLDDSRGIEVVEGYRTLDVPGVPQRVRVAAELDLDSTGWPAQALIVRRGDGAPGDVVKGLNDFGRLSDAVATCAARSADGYAVVEPDLRAQHNPSRRVVLAQLAGTLALRLATGCPACASPGYGRTGTECGLPCADCGTPTELARADVLTCAVCSYEELRLRSPSLADAQWCPGCNP